MDDILKDSRFAKYVNDPKYRQIPKHERKVKIDKRFQAMFKDEKFKVKYTIDKRGRPINETSTENLRKYYDLEDSDENSNLSEQVDLKDSSEKNSNEEGEVGRYVRRPSTEIQIEDTETNDKSNPFLNDKLTRGKLNSKIKERLLDLDVDYARGEGVLLSDSSSDEDSSAEEEDSELEHEWGQLDADAGTTEESTKRIALCNMDWDNIKASDLMVLLSSFLPPGGLIVNVSIYPSEYGLTRMQEEEVRGPLELTKDNAEDISDAEGNEEGSKYHMEKLRRYQLNRLKYYYAVVECDTVATADKLYSECDGLEYESSATRIDMRFIPDDVTFDHEPREICTKLPDLAKYKPRLFTTTALQQAKVELTWDATNPNRAEFIKSALNGKLDDLDVRDYLGSSSEDEDVLDKLDNQKKGRDSDSDNDDPIQKYKILLNDIKSKEDKKTNKDMEMEITWGLGVKDRAEEMLKKKLNEEDNDMTPFEKLLKKRKEKKNDKKLKRKENMEREKNKLDDIDTDDDIPSSVDMNDPYFAEEFNKAEFRKEKSKGKQNSTEENLNEESEKQKAELELLLDDENDGKAHFSLKKIQETEAVSKKSKRKKKLKQKSLEHKNLMPDFDVDVNDKRFSALYDSHLFNIDPSDPNYKKTKNMEKLIQEKLKRRPAEYVIENETSSKKSKQEAELNQLVNNVKRKTKNFVLLK